MLSRFHPIPERCGRTDRIARQYAELLTRDKKTTDNKSLLMEISYVRVTGLERMASGPKHLI